MNGLIKRVAALESLAPFASCRTCVARAVFTMLGPDEGARPCPECGRELPVFTIDIDAASGREDNR